MASVAVRIGKLLMIIGITFLLISFVPSSEFGFSSEVEHGAYEGRVFGAVGNTYIEVYTYNSSVLCVYIVSYDELMIALENASLEETHPLIALEGIKNYSDVIEIPLPGMYAILVTPYNNETIFFHIEVARPLPHSGILFTGIILTLAGFITILLLGTIRETWKRHIWKTQQ